MAKGEPDYEGELLGQLERRRETILRRLEECPAPVDAAAVTALERDLRKSTIARDAIRSKALAEQLNALRVQSRRYRKFDAERAELARVDRLILREKTKSEPRKAPAA